MTPTIPPMASCLACRAPVAMAQTERGRPIPLELGEFPLGNLAVPRGCGEGAPVVRYLRNGAGAGRGEWRAVTHLDVCPERARRRGRRR